MNFFKWLWTFIISDVRDITNFTIDLQTDMLSITKKNLIFINYIIEAHQSYCEHFVVPLAFFLFYF